MKFAMRTALLFLLLGTPGYPQQQEQQPPRQNPERATPPQDRQQNERERQQQQQQERQQRERQQEQDRARGQARENEKQDMEMQRREKEQSERQQQQVDRDRAQQDRASRERAVQQQQQAQRQQQERARQAQRDYGNRSGRRVREEDFRAHFGPEHRFHVDRRDDRHFRYRGYWFVYTEPWPSDWNYNDDVYLDDIDREYYLIDSLHPGFRLRVILQD